MTTTVARWAAVLDAIEVDLERVDGALRDGRPAAVTAWQPPRDLGPVPPQIRYRAESVARRITRMQEQARVRAAELRSDLEDLARRRDAGHAYAALDPGVDLD